MRRVRLSLGAAAVALVLTPAASAHGGGGAAAGYRSTVAGLEPPVLGVLVTVLGGDDRLRAVNYSGKTIVVSGYEGEPYLRFARTASTRTCARRPAYLSRERDPATATVPASADASAPPRWRQDRCSRVESVVWHDHRIHWVRSAGRPASPASAGRDPQHLRLAHRRPRPTASRSRSPASSATRRRRRSTSRGRPRLAPWLSPAWRASACSRSPGSAWGPAADAAGPRAPSSATESGTSVGQFGARRAVRVRAVDPAVRSRPARPALSGEAASHVVREILLA